MSVRLVLLGLLHDQPLYGYEIKQIIEEHMGDWTSIAFGSIYFALDKLSEEKLVEKVSVEQMGNRPSRIVYQITPAGEEEFLRLLRESWQNIEREYYEVDICLFFLNRLSTGEVKKYLQARLAQLEGSLKYLKSHEETEISNPEIPPQAKAIFSHTRIHLQAEYEWTRDFLSSVEMKN
jgi:DNA-binding PadR family transcriptional regulator